MKLVQPNGTYAGVHYGRIAVRANSKFDLLAKGKKITSSAKNFALIQRADGYTYSH